MHSWKLCQAFLKIQHSFREIQKIQMGLLYKLLIICYLWLKCCRMLSKDEKLEYQCIRNIRVLRVYTENSTGDLRGCQGQCSCFHLTSLSDIFIVTLNENNIHSTWFIIRFLCFSGTIFSLSKTWSVDFDETWLFIRFQTLSSAFIWVEYSTYIFVNWVY